MVEDQLVETLQTPGSGIHIIHFYRRNLRVAMSEELLSLAHILVVVGRQPEGIRHGSECKSAQPSGQHGRGGSHRQPSKWSKKSGWWENVKFCRVYGFSMADCCWTSKKCFKMCQTQSWNKLKRYHWGSENVGLPTLCLWTQHPKCMWPDLLHTTFPS